MEETPSTMVITVVNNPEDDALIDPHLPIFDRSQECEPTTHLNTTRGGRSIKPTQKQASRSRFGSVLWKGIERRLWLGLTSVSNRDFSKISIGSCAPFVFLINWTIQSGVSETFAFLKLRKVMQHGTEVSNLEDAAGCSNDQTAQRQARIISGNAGRLLPPPSKQRLYDELLWSRAHVLFSRGEGSKGVIGFTPNTTPNTLAIRSALINAKYFGISKICIKSDRQVFVKATDSIAERLSVMANSVSAT
ncbi:hypothetical protein DY000_02005608 [Brassica cretica]|uniref:RNase H type-1 domain-containing protein n=1 Tax=Brassica cretica TaxID=69181 RepID=A0ABQ7BYD4_BRACR|nr:hypothetical protein DY000_02005608 [Brassica cretica]